MKKLVSVLLILAMCLALFSATAVAEGEPTIRVSNATVVDGQVTVDVSIENNPGVAGIELGLDYDTNALTLKSAAANMAQFPGQFKVVTNFVWSGGNNTYENGVVGSLTFTTNEAFEMGKDYPINIILKTVCDEDGEDVQVTLVSGSVRGECQHVIVTDAAVAATCTEPGKTAGTHCSVCGVILSGNETIPATGHTVVTDAAVAATCTETGKTEGKHCSVCNAVIVAQETTTATGHTVVTDAAVAPTCTETGKTEGSHCSVCGTVLVAQEVVPALGHDWNDGVVTKEATCSEAGVMTYTCKNDESHTKTEAIPTLPHTEVIDAEVAPTCTETGLTEGKHCSVCNEVLVEQEVVPKLDHDWGDGVVTTEAKCTEDGFKTYICSRCGEMKFEVIKALGHDWKNGECTRCDAKVTTSNVTPDDTLKNTIDNNKDIKKDKYQVYDLQLEGADNSGTYRVTFSAGLGYTVVYHVKADGSLEKVSGVTAANGTVSFNYDLANGDNIFVVAQPATKTPSTGDESRAFEYAALAMLGLCCTLSLGAVTILRKKEN